MWRHVQRTVVNFTMLWMTLGQGGNWWWVENSTSNSSMRVVQAKKTRMVVPSKMIVQRHMGHPWGKRLDDPFDLLKYRGSYKTSNHFKSTLYKYSFITNEGKFETTLKKIETSEFKRKTNLSIVGFLLVSPGFLWSFVFLFRPSKQLLYHWNLEHSAYWFSVHH